MHNLSIFVAVIEVYGNILSKERYFSCMRTCVKIPTLVLYQN